MKKIAEQLKVAKAEHKIALKAFNMAQRRLHRVLVTINTLEKKHELALSKSTPVGYDRTAGTRPVGARAQDVAARHHP